MKHLDFNGVDCLWLLVINLYLYFTKETQMFHSDQARVKSKSQVEAPLCASHPVKLLLPNIVLNLASSVIFAVVIVLNCQEKKLNFIYFRKREEMYLSIFMLKKTKHTIFTFRCTRVKCLPQSTCSFLLEVKKVCCVFLWKRILLF